MSASAFSTTLPPLHRPLLHDIFQLLYYLPIILAAFWFGLRGGAERARFDLAAELAEAVALIAGEAGQCGVRVALQADNSRCAWPGPPASPLSVR